MPNANNDVVAEYMGVRRALMDASHSHPQAGALYRTISDLERYLSRPMRVVVLGEHNSGKTALINAILGRQMLPTAVVANTPVSVTMRFGPLAAIRAQSRSGAWHNIDRTRPFDEFDIRGLRAVEIQSQNPLLKQFEFVDTPAAEDPRSNIPGADFVIWCTNATRAWSQTERTAWMALPRRCRGNGVLVATHSDSLVSTADREKVLNRLQDEISDSFEHIHLLSCAPNNDPHVPAGRAPTDIEALLQSLQEMSLQQRTRRGQAADRIANRLSKAATPAITRQKAPIVNLEPQLAN